MLRDITLGQYYPTKSLLHRLDPRVKLYGTMIFLICVFLINDLVTLGLMTFALFTVIKLSRVPIKFMVRGLKAVMILMLITACFNVFLSQGEPIWSWYFLHVTREGIVLAVKMVFRLTYIVMGTSVMTLTTTPNQLTDGLEKGLGFLKKIHVPVHEIAMMMSIALRFIPILVEETDKVMKAQAARGAGFGEGKLLDRAKALVPVLVPLFVSAFRRANDLAMAMEARCYNGGEGRTKMKPLTYTRTDKVCYPMINGFCILMIAARIWL